MLIRFRQSAIAVALSLAWVASSQAAALTPGDSWNRKADYSVAGTPGVTTSVSSPNAGVWVYEYILPGGGVGALDPWYDDARTTRVLEDAFNSGNLSWMQTEFRGPRSFENNDLFINSANQAMPAVRWLSPGDGVISIDGVFAVRNAEDGTSIDVDYAIVHLDAGGAVKALLESGTLTTTGSVAGTTVLDEEVTVLENESILFTIQPQDLGNDLNVEMMTLTGTTGLTDDDRVTITVVPEPACVALFLTGAACMLVRRRS